MKQLFVFLGAAFILAGAGLAVPGPAHAIPPFDCSILQPSSPGQPTIYGINEVSGPLVTPETNECFIETQSFGTTPIHIDVLQQGQPLNGPPGGTPPGSFPPGSTPVSDYVDLTFFQPNINSHCSVLAFCTDIRLTSDLGAPTGLETGLPAVCLTASDAGGACVRFTEDANGVGIDPANPGLQTPFGLIACNEYTDPTNAKCLAILSDADNQEISVPEPSSALLLGAVLPGLFGYRRLSRRALPA